MIEIYDEVVPLRIRNYIYNFAVNSNYRIVGWNDSDDLELRSKHDFHSPWTLQDLKDSKIVPYLEKVLKKSKFNFTMDDFFKCTINAVKPGDYYYTHTHLDGVISLLYYINLEWRHNWAGETIFYKENMREVDFTSPYIPGRFILFDNEPHTIRPQAVIGPAFRFTMALFFKKA